MRPLENKRAIVTGSTSGIGLGIAASLAETGAKVMLNGFGDAGEIEAIRARLAKQFDTEVHYHGADMSKVADIAALAGTTRKAFGGIDIVVNNAGIQHVSPIEDFPPEKWDAIIAINLTSAFHLARLTFGDMKQAGWGRIVNIASAHGLVASPFKSAYVAAKHGVIGLTKTIALEGAEHGITCNAICPGYVLTPLVEKQIPDTARARGISNDAVVRDVLLASQATKKFVTVEQLGALAVFLCTDQASQITGTALPMDGGWTAH
ncbi:MAG: 3-hydroxybutyrate dehydrogenase [Alphaproteobacteria bacterium]|nr:3-hydroxybutyrate dehydrogenase [Alphaproteobacteria bacterium]